MALKAAEELSWEVRARAAERTVEVLKRRLRAIDSGEEKTTIQRQLESSQRRAAENRRRQELSELRTAELQRFNDSLAQEVSARTEQIRTILDHVSTGLLLLDPQLRVLPGWSHSCALLLGDNELSGMPLAEVLQWDPELRVEFEIMAEQVFDDILPEEVAAGQIPGRVRLKGRELELTYSPVRKDGQVISILATIVDVTAQITAERQARLHRRLVNLLLQRDAFARFVNDTKQTLAAAQLALAQHDEASVRRAVHTIKGNSATFMLDEVVEITHTVESCEQIEPLHLVYISDALQSFLLENHAVLGIEPGLVGDVEQTYSLTALEIEQLAERVREHGASEVTHLLRRLRTQPANDFVQPLRVAMARWNERLQKDVQLVVEGGELGIDPVQLAPVLRCLPHLVRNAMDHGIESGSERGDKPPQGTLRIAFQELEKRWEILVADDGRGIDPQRVGQIAVERGLLTAEAASKLDLAGAVNLLSQDGFSTAGQVTEISGRGVGLSAVRVAIEDLAGELDIESEVGRGTRFFLRVPKLAVG